MEKNKLNKWQRELGSNIEYAKNLSKMMVWTVGASDSEVKGNVFGKVPMRTEKKSTKSRFKSMFVTQIE